MFWSEKSWFRSLGSRCLRWVLASFEPAASPLLAGVPGHLLPGPSLIPSKSAKGSSARTSAHPPATGRRPGFLPPARLARTGRPGSETGQPGNDSSPDRPDEGNDPNNLGRRDDPGPPQDSARPGKPGEETAYTPQPSPRDGVPEDMATMVLDSPALVAGSAPRPNPASELGSNPRGEVDPASDAAVMLRVAAGDEGSFNFLVGKYHRPMIHFLYRMVHNQAVAEELAQEVFLRVYRARDSYRAEARFTTWLYRIATNLAVNHARDTRHERSAQTVYLDAPDEETGATPDVADDEPTVEQRLLRDERMTAIRSHVMALPERQRMAVLMHKYQGMDYRQIGEVLKLSESATKSLLFRAYQTLREKLKGFV
jgi:RNA polymerase sigma-70 factor (ECF subfamily)